MPNDILSQDPVFAAEASWFTAQFPPEVRSSGISLVYNCVSLIAGTLPFVATALFSQVGWIGPALLFSLLGVMSRICALKMRETAPVIMEASAGAGKVSNGTAHLSRAVRH